VPDDAIMPDSPTPPPPDSGDAPGSDQTAEAAAAEDAGAGEQSPATDGPADPPGDGGPRKTKRRRKRTWRRFLFRWTIRGLLFAVAIYFVALGPLIAGIGGIIASQVLDANVRIDAVEGSFFTSLRLRGIKVSAPPDDLPIRDAYVGEVALSYDLIGLISGAEDWLGPVIVSDVRVGVDLRHSPPPAPEEPPEPVDLPDALPIGMLPELRVRDVTVRLVIDDERWVQINRLSVRGERDRDDRYRLAVGIEQLGGALLPGGPLPERSLDVLIHVMPAEVEVALVRWGDEALIGARAGSGPVGLAGDPLTPSGLRLVLDGATEQLRATGRIALFSGEITIDSATADLSAALPKVDAQVAWGNLTPPDDLAAWLGVELPPLAVGPVSGSVTASADLADPIGSALAELAVAVPECRALGVPVAVDLAFSAADGRVDVTTAAVDLPGLAVRVDGEPLDLIALLPPEPIAASDAAGAPAESGRLALADLLSALAADVDVTLTDLADAREWLTADVAAIIGPGGMSALGGIDWEALRGGRLTVRVASAAGDAAATATVAITLPGGAGEITLGPITAAPTPDAEDWTIAGPVAIALPDLAAIPPAHQALASLPDLVGAVRIDATVSGTSAAPSAEVRVGLTSVGLADPAVPAVSGTISADADLATDLRGAVAVDLRADATGDRVLVSAAGELVGGAPRLIELATDVMVRDLAAYLPDAGLQGRVVARTTGRLDVGEPQRFDLPASADATADPPPPITLPQVRLAVAVDDLTAGGMHVTSLRLDAVAEPTVVDIERLAVRTPLGAFDLSAGASLDLDRGKATADLRDLRLAWRSHHLSLAEPTRVVVMLPDADSAAPPPANPLAALPEIGFDRPLTLSGTLGRIQIDGAPATDPAPTVQLSISGGDLPALVADLGLDVPVPGKLQIAASANRTGARLRVTTGGTSLAPFAPLTADATVDVAFNASTRRLRIQRLRVAVEPTDRAVADASGATTLTLDGSLPVDPFAGSPAAMLPGAEPGATAPHPPMSLRLALSVADPAWLAGFLPETLGFAVPTGRLTVDAELAGDWHSPIATVRVRTSNLTVPGLTPAALADMLAAGSPPATDADATADATAAAPLTAELLAGVERFQQLSLALDAEWRAGEATLSRADVNIPNADVRVGLSARTQWPATVGALLQGRPPAEPGDIRARVTGRLGALASLPLPTAAVRSLTGAVDWEIDAVVPAGNLGGLPELTGSISLRDIAVRAGGAPPVAGLNATIAMAERRIELQDFRADVGGGEFTIRGGADLSDPERAAIDVRVRGSNALVARSPGMRVRADVDIRAAGDLPLAPTAAVTREEILAIGGVLTVRDSRVAQVVDMLGVTGGGGGGGDGAASPDLVLFSIDAEPLSRVRFDGLQVRTAPGETVEVATNVFKGRVSLGLEIGGTLQAPQPVGDVSIREGRVELPATALDLQTCLVRFDPTRPFDPTVTVFATTRMRGFDISVSFTGRLSEMGDLEVRFASDPPLPSEEVSLLVLTGKPPESAVGSKSAAGAAQRLAIYLGKGVLAALLSDEESLDNEGESLLDRLEVESGQSISESGAETIEVRFRLTSDLMSDDDTLYVVGERDVFDEYNAGLALRFRFR
jgi:hypothetical protein